jgi:hypothetical protein
MRFAVTTFVGLLVGLVVYSASADAQRSSTADKKAARVALVREFVREMEVLYRLQETAKKEFNEDNSPSAKIATSIRNGTRNLLEMDDSIRRLNMISALDERWANARDLLTRSHQQRMLYVQEMTEIAKTMLSGPEQGVNYGELAARAPQLTAFTEQIDKSMFDMAQMLFLGLVDEDRTTADGKLDHLIISKRERASMIQLIDSAFGRALDDKNATTVVSAAWTIKYGLTRPNYKAADEP